VPTLLIGSPLRSRVAGHNLTYAEWTPTSGPHPKTLGMEDLPSLQSSSKLFARKFEPMWTAWSSMSSTGYTLTSICIRKGHVGSFLHR
jgi:hypothetical protein